MALEIPECPNCNSQLVKKEKAGRTFYTCPNWRADGSGCDGYIWSPEGKPKKSGDNEIVEQLKTMNNTLVSIAKSILAGNKGMRDDDKED